MRLKLRDTDDAPRIPPTPCLRLLLRCSNVRVFPRGPGVMAEELGLWRLYRDGPISHQDVQICATALAIQRATRLQVALVTCDKQIRKWGKVPVLW